MKTLSRFVLVSLGAWLCFSFIFQDGIPAAAEPVSKTASLPLGPSDLKETRKTTPLAPGVSHTQITRGKPSENDYYTVDAAFRPTKAEAETEARQLEADGYTPVMQPIDERAPDDPQSGPLGYLVHVGHFAGQKEADSLKAELTAKGYSDLRVVHTAENGGPTTGPWNIHVLKIDPKQFKGSVLPRLGTEVVPGKERLTDMSVRTRALAGVNGGYFVMGDPDGTTGDLAGMSVIDGKPVSEAVNGRTGLILPSASGKGAKVANMKTKLTAISSHGAHRELDGINRKPGVIRGCGGTGGDAPTELPKHDFTCTDESELIQFTPAFGNSTEPGTGAEAVLDEKGRVTDVRETRGGAIPEQGSVLSATGEAVNWLRAHAKPGSRINVDAGIYADGKRLSLQQQTGIINGGPRLLQQGKNHITAFAEGFHWKEKPEFYYRFGVRRNPRTLTGTTPDGHILFVTVDGRKPDSSVGASFKESAEIMKALGASEAVNLDGGGSTAMTVRQQLVNRPSDDTGERPIGDAVLIFSGRK